MSFTVLLVDDDTNVRTAFRKMLVRLQHETVEAAELEDALQLFDTHQPDLVLTDYYLGSSTAVELLTALQQRGSMVPFVVLTGQATIDLAVETMQKGADHFLSKPVSLATLRVVVERMLKSSQDRRRRAAEEARSKRNELDPFQGNSDAIKRLREMAEAVADTQAPVLLLGETGAGKGVLAKWFHQNSASSMEPFVDLNCAGLSKELAESELFGHKRGAFTSASSDKPGLLEVAHRGTLFLDEVGDLDLSVQPKLLKVLEDCTFRRVGDVRVRKAQVRLIAATHRDLGTMASSGKFRSDLLFRINTVTLNLPPLRQRLEDMESLVRVLLADLGVRGGMGPKDISPSAMAQLKSYAWPGNIRELRNVLERATLFCKGPEITSKHLVFAGPAAVEADDEAVEVASLADVERQHIQKIVRAHNGRVEAAASVLGLARSSLYAKMKRYGITAS